jgi:Tfp pilus assembly protein PilF
MPTPAELLDQAVRLHQIGRLDQAENLCRQILQADPDHIQAWHLLGLLARQAGRPELAAEHFDRVVCLIPDSAPAHNNLGSVLRELGRTAQAESCFRQALSLMPNSAEVNYNLGNVLIDQGRYEEGEALYRAALRLKPDYAQVHNKLGLILQEQGRPQEAEACFRKALSLKPDQGQWHFNLGVVLRELGKLQEAEACFRQALRLQPDFGDAHFNLSMALLQQGKFAQGWPEFEWRWLAHRGQPQYVPPPITWDGGALDGQTILIQAEQGFGDIFQFIRYTRLLKAKGGRVLVRCPKELEGILAGCPGIDHVLTHDRELPPFDKSAPLLSLPMLCGTSLETIPANIPYLFADPALIRRWQQELGDYSGFKIGIVWQGNPRSFRPECRSADRRRSFPLAHFESLADLPGIRLFSLQKGFGSEQLAAWRRPGDIVDLGEKLPDFTDTAAVMMNLDLIISADTSPAHLAGALGRRVWTVLPFAGCWRWLTEREVSPWYPSMRLFRQRQAGDWVEVFQRMAQELIPFSKKPGTWPPEETSRRPAECG